MERIPAIMAAAMRHYLACDLGAESGRLMLGSLAADRIQIRELHRFANGAVTSGDSLHWNLAGLFDSLASGLRIAAKLQQPMASISTDSWGVDYVLQNAAGRLMEPVYHYRDPRTAQGVARVRERVDPALLFQETGIQFMPLNTIYQLAAEPPERLAQATRLLLVGDAFNHHLCGVPVAEVSLASTTQLYNPLRRTWSDRLLKSLDLPPRLFPPLAPPGTVLGPLRPEIAAETGWAGTKTEIVATCSHDTGAAVAAVPVCQDDWAYISSGTWSLMGVELNSPVLSEACQRLNFTNEMGYGHSVRLLKNIIGLWLVQECRRTWANAGNALSYEALTRLASDAAPFRSLINPQDPRFLAPGDMPGRIAAFCRETGQPVPDREGAYARCALESLALLYRRTAHQLAELVGRPIRVLHIVGGGSQNDCLNQFTASALNVPVMAGPVEATALGNVLVQALALNHLSSLAEARRLVRVSFPLTRFEPRDLPSWDAAADRFETLCGTR